MSDDWFALYAAGDFLPDLAADAAAELAAYAQGHADAAGDVGERLRVEWWDGYAAATADLSHVPGARRRRHLTRPGGRRA